MSQATRDLWPHTVDVSSVVPPLVILREQAALLGERTKGLVRADVESTQQSHDKIDDYLEEVLPPEARVVYSHTLYLLAPALDNYRYSLLSVEHDIVPYPCAVRFHPKPSAYWQGVPQEMTGACLISREELFVEWLRRALTSNETVRIVQALVVRVQQLGRGGT